MEMEKLKYILRIQVQSLVETQNTSNGIIQDKRGSYTMRSHFYFLFQLHPPFHFSLILQLYWTIFQSINLLCLYDLIYTCSQNLTPSNKTLPFCKTEFKCYLCEISHSSILANKKIKPIEDGEKCLPKSTSKTNS